MKWLKVTVSSVYMSTSISTNLMSELTYSSDSTSHKHIEYESRTIAIRVVDYTKPEAEPTWKLRTLGIGTSANHASQTQVNGLRQRLTEIADIFNNSPLAKREALTFLPDHFAFKLIGTSGDHAADQKKSHEILREWKLEVVFQRLGEEAIFNMGATRVVSFLLPMKAKQVEEMGGYDVWTSLTDEEKTKADGRIIRSVGRQVFEELSMNDKASFMLFIRTGCCMHKDLNTVKGGNKAMQESWKKSNLTPPILLANKDNTAILERASTSLDPSPAEKRAVDVSKRGGSHATMLGGLICRNKDKKKGQQDTYDWYMEKHVGLCVPYPDVSNTRYGTHGEAAATLVVYRAHFICFMEFVRDAKDRPGLTNIEKNFLNALSDGATFTELCVLALYYVNVSRPFMRHVRQHDNLLKLGPFFQKKRDFIHAICEDPTRWTQRAITSDESHSFGTLDGCERDEWATLVMKMIHSQLHIIPHLETAIKAFMRGAWKTFAERFSDEFLEGGDIDKLSLEERERLFFPSTNDVNEGALGSWRLGQRRRPRETIHKFTAAFTSRQNSTEDFHQQLLNTEEDEAYLRKQARVRDTQKLQKQVKETQMKADAEKVLENHQKDLVRKEKRTKAAANITATGRHLVLDDAAIERLKLPEINRQLDWHRDNEIRKQEVLDLPENVRVPLKTHMGNKPDRVLILKKAVVRYQEFAELRQASDNILEANEDVEMAEPSGEDSFYQSDYDDDTV